MSFTPRGDDDVRIEIVVSSSLAFTLVPCVRERTLGWVSRSPMRVVYCKTDREAQHGQHGREMEMMVKTFCRRSEKESCALLPSASERR